MGERLGDSKRHCGRQVSHCLHFFLEQKIPDEILENVSDQIRQVQPVAKRLDQYSEEEVTEFPKFFDW